MLAVSLVSGQDPVATLPDSYRVQFENEWVKVVRVHYPAGTTAYVYLNDSDGVVFRHSGRSTRAVTRPPVKAGGVRVASGAAEHHTAENPAPTPSDFLRLQFKTDAKGGRNVRRRIPPGSYPATEHVTDVQFTNGQMRITRILLPAGQSVELTTAAAEPALLIALSPAALAVARGSSDEISMTPGQDRWLDAAQRERVTNTGGVSVELLRFDFLTPPA